MLRCSPLKMTEHLRAEGTPAGLTEEAEEVLVEVFHEDQGLGPKVDFCFFKWVVFFHLNQMKKPKPSLTGDAEPARVPERSPGRCRSSVCPPPRDSGRTSACQHPCTHTACSLEGHLPCSLIVLLHRRGIPPPTD